MRLWLLLAAGLAAVAASFPFLGGKPEPERRLEWGLYQIYWGRGFAQRLETELAKLASHPDYVMFYRDLGRAFPKGPIEVIRRFGATPVVSLELWHWHDRRRGEKGLPAVVRGDYDELFRSWAREARAEGGRILLRFGFEMNGEWFPWSGDPPAFVAAWRRAHAIFAAEGARNVEWVWCPNVVSIPRTPQNAMHHYYPGNDVVDWVALDGYNFGDDHDEWHRWESFERVFGGALEELTKRYPEKPIMIGETACAPGERRATWIREAYAALARRPQVRALIWFHYDKRRENEPDWRIDCSPESLAAFNETFARR